MTVSLPDCSLYVKNVYFLFAHAVFFEAIPYDDLLIMVDFMYTGRLTIDASQLNSIMDTSDELKFLPLMHRDLRHFFGENVTNLPIAGEVKPVPAAATTSAPPNPQSPAPLVPVTEHAVDENNNHIGSDEAMAAPEPLASRPKSTAFSYGFY